MIDVDVILHTRTSSKLIFEMTKIALMMLHDSEKEHNFKVFLYETDPDSTYDYSPWVYKSFVDIEPYNCCRLINKANPYITNNWVLIINNDLRFEREWFSKIIEVYNKRPDIESFSPKCPILYSEFFDFHFVGSDEDYYESYKVNEFMAGWCYVMRKRVWDAVYPWDEQFAFHYADNDYAEKIKSLGIKHALVRDSIVTHLGSKSTAQNASKILNKEDELKFRKKWNIWE